MGVDCGFGCGVVGVTGCGLVGDGFGLAGDGFGAGFGTGFEGDLTGADSDIGVTVIPDSPVKLPLLFHPDVSVSVWDTSVSESDKVGAFDFDLELITDVSEFPI